MQTNGTDRTIPLTINDMWNAIDRLKNEHHYPPPSEFRIHPDDYEELKRQAKPYPPHPNPMNPYSMFGLKIVIDTTAERLPRKRRGQ